MRARRIAIDVAGLGLFIAGTVLASLHFGLVFLLRDWLWVWLLAGLLAVSLTDLRRYARGVLVDWLPFIAIIIGYDIVRGIADHGTAAAHYRQQIAAERWLFGGELPTVWLQRQLFDMHHLQPWDYVAWAVYNTHFATTIALAGVLWRVAPALFGRFRAMVAVVALTAMTTFVLYPSLPPWLASRHAHIEHVDRVVNHVWLHVGLQPGHAIFEQGSRWANQVAAWPSLHAAFPMLILLFFSSRGWVVRAALAAYVALMSWALVYTGEHYVVDILAGWGYAAAGFTIVTLTYRHLPASRAAIGARRRRRGRLSPV